MHRDAHRKPAMDNTSSGSAAFTRNQKLPERQVRSFPRTAPCWCPLQEGGVRTDDEHFETLTAVVASWPEQEIERLMQQPGIIRNRKKIVATLRNAGELMRLRRRYGSVQAYLKNARRGRSGLVQTVDGWAHYIGAPSIRCYLTCAGLDPDTHKKERYHRESD